MFWIVVAVIALVLGALAWWSSGRDTKRSRVDQRLVDNGRDRDIGRAIRARAHSSVGELRSRRYYEGR